MLRKLCFIWWLDLWVGNDFMKCSVCIQRVIFNEMRDSVWDFLYIFPFCRSLYCNSLSTKYWKSCVRKSINKMFLHSLLFVTIDQSDRNENQNANLSKNIHIFSALHSYFTQLLYRSLLFSIYYIRYIKSFTFTTMCQFIFMISFIFRCRFIVVVIVVAAAVVDPIQWFFNLRSSSIVFSNFFSHFTSPNA